MWRSILIEVYHRSSISCNRLFSVLDTCRSVFLRGVKMSQLSHKIDMVKMMYKCVFLSKLTRCGFVNIKSTEKKITPVRSCLVCCLIIRSLSELHENFSSCTNCLLRSYGTFSSLSSTGLLIHVQPEWPVFCTDCPAIHELKLACVLMGKTLRFPRLFLLFWVREHHLKAPRLHDNIYAYVFIQGCFFFFLY